MILYQGIMGVISLSFSNATRFDGWFLTIPLQRISTEED